MWRHNKLTEQALAAVQKAESLAQQYGQQQIQPLHLLLALVSERDGVVQQLLVRLKIRPEDLRKDTEAELRKLPKVSDVTQIFMGQEANQVMEKAFEEAEKVFKDDFAHADHILLAIASREKDPAGQLLVQHGASREAILQALQAVRGRHRVTSDNP